MDRKEADAIVRKLKEGARANPWVPHDVAPPERYHHFPDGLSLCFTLDVLPWGRFWHLSIAHPGTALTPAEVDFWRRAFFEAVPTGEMSGVIKAMNSRHFFWRASEASQEM